MKRLLILTALLVTPMLATAQTITVGPATVRTQSGLIDLHGATMAFGTSGMLDEAGGRLTNGTLTASRTLNRPRGQNVAGLGAAITASTNLGVTTVTRGHTAQAGAGNTGIDRYFVITPTIKSKLPLNATLTFHYAEGELNGYDEAQLQLWQSTDDGTTWAPLDGTVNTDVNTITVTGLNALAQVTASALAAPLPVELTRFEAQVDGAAVRLAWATATETTNAGFEVQQRAASTDTDDWQPLAFIDGHGTTLQAQHYEYRIENLAPGRYQFRLKQVDYDGAFDYSPEVEVQIELAEAFALSPAYPNPFNPTTHVTLSVAQPQRVTVVAYDVLGRRVATLFDGTLAAHHARDFTFEAGSRASGLYVIRAEGETFVASQRVLLVK